MSDWNKLIDVARDDRQWWAKRITVLTQELQEAEGMYAAADARLDYGLRMQEKED